MGRKNKHGERGSTEEYFRISKKSNMATEEDSIHADQEEPNLLEINEILVVIQISITSVVKENKALRKERSQRQRQFQREGTPRLERVVAKDKRRNKVLHRNLLDATKTRKKNDK